MYSLSQNGYGDMYHMKCAGSPGVFFLYAGGELEMSGNYSQETHMLSRCLSDFLVYQEGLQ